MMHARDATRYARLAQGATLALAVAAVLAGFVSLPRVAEPAPSATSQTSPQNSGKQDGAFPVDFEGIIVRLASTHNAPTPPEPEQATPDEPPDDPGQPDDPTPARPQQAPIRYLGALHHSGGKAWAIVAHQGKQTWLALGGTLDGRTLVVVEDDHIVVEDESGDQSEIPLAPLSATRTTRVTPGVPSAASIRDRVIGGPGGPGAREIPDARRRMIEKAREEQGDR